MKQKRHITGFYIETLLLIVVFISIILVITNIFGLARVRSAQARHLTKAVTLAQNAAEAAAASTSIDEAAAILDENGNVKAVRAGKAKITCASVDGGDTVVSTITVTHKHNMVKHEYEEESCSSIGEKEYWVCADYDFSLLLNGCIYICGNSDFEVIA